MAYEHYEKYVKSKETPSLFTLKAPYGLTNNEALFLASNVQNITNSNVLPKNKIFDHLSEDNKRMIINRIFQKSPMSYEYTKKLYKKYFLNSEQSVIEINNPYYKYLSPHREKIFEKAQNLAKNRFLARTVPNYSNTQNIVLLPSVYSEQDDYFKIMQEAKKYQTHFKDQPQSIHEIVHEAKQNIIYNFYNNRKNFIAYFPIDAIDKMGRYYTLFKQIEFNISENTCSFSVSITVNVIPKSRPQYQHQLLRFDLGGFHTNATKNKDNKNKIQGAHIHLFTKESNFIYGKNPTTADAIDLQKLYSVCKGKEENHLSNHPCIKNLNEHINKFELFEFNLLEQKLAKENYTNTEILKILKDNNVSIVNTTELNENNIDNMNNVIITHQKDPSRNAEEYQHFCKYILCLNAIELMDNIVDNCLNIEKVPYSVNDKEYVEQLICQTESIKTYDGDTTQSYLQRLNSENDYEKE